MKIINDTPFKIETLPTKGPKGNTVLTIIVKGTFDIQHGEPATVASEQIPVTYGDEFHNGKAEGSVKFESDVAPFKPCTDIVLVGKAYAPGGRPVQILDVSLRVGKIKKTIRVFGNRYRIFTSWLFSEVASKPQPFTVMNLVYERSFGGMDREGGDWCKENPIGCGFLAKRSKKTLNGTPLPNLEDPNSLIKSWKDHPKPVGLGFYGRTWMPRASCLGTYDEKWRKECSPDPPQDFCFEYYNGAHPDLQVKGYLKGDEKVELINLIPEGNIHFQLPGIKPTCTVTKSLELIAPSASITEKDNLEWNNSREIRIENESQEAEDSSPIKEVVNLNLDTLCLIPDEKRFYMIWRGFSPIDNLSASEVKTVEVG